MAFHSHLSAQPNSVHVLTTKRLMSGAKKNFPLSLERRCRNRLAYSTRRLPCDSFFHPKKASDEREMKWLVEDSEEKAREGELNINWDKSPSRQAFNARRTRKSLPPLHARFESSGKRVAMVAGWSQNLITIYRIKEQLLRRLPPSDRYGNFLVALDDSIHSRRMTLL